MPNPDPVAPHAHSVNDLPVGTGPGMIPTNDDIANTIGAVRVPIVGAITGIPGAMTVTAPGVADGSVFAADRAGTPDATPRAFRVRLWDSPAPGVLLPSAAGILSLTPAGAGSVVWTHSPPAANDLTVLSAGPGIVRFDLRVTNPGVMSIITVEPADDDSFPPPFGTGASQGVLWQPGVGQSIAL